ncbi:dinI-like protein in retron EC67 [Enterobacter cloacae]|uniref:Tum protein n=1 Tax=Enterobacter TaxID=547 RepID=UPI000794B7A1|nr:Tum protein [Enterobacter cloacae]CZV71060.1 dinI-like protein in retron EC67 [Enterobacter cloacae]HAS0906135.1 Tum protein [Enterobacter cloacae]
MNNSLTEEVAIERVEMIARLVAEGECRDRDREIALGLIAEILRDALPERNCFSIIFSKQDDLNE